MSGRLKEYFFIGLGSLFLLIGVVGIFLPLLPTTPFLILTAYCFNRGSSRFHSWLLAHRIFGPPILDWQQNRVIKSRYKVMATVTMTISSIYIFTNDVIPVIGKGSYAVAVLALMYFLWSQKSTAA